MFLFCSKQYFKVEKIVAVSMIIISVNQNNVYTETNIWTLYLFIYIVYSFIL